MKTINYFDQKLLDECDVSAWGVTNESKAKSFSKFNKWVDSGHHGGLNYLSDHRKDKRKDLKNIFPQFKSAFVFLFSYKKFEKFENELKIASYALGFEGKDYHFYLREKLQKLGHSLQEKFGCKILTTLDIEPVLDRDLAYRAGLGWYGKNSMLINKKLGSYFLIGSVLTDLEINQDAKLETDHCGHCQECIVECPTDAINDDRTIAADKCVSTYTIEVFKESPAPHGYKNLENEIFGCDICQETCPWNNKVELAKFNSVGVIEHFFKREKGEIINELEGMSNRKYKKMFRGTALDRPGRVGMLKNLKALKKK